MNDCREKKPKVSLIIPVYNVLAFLDHCLDSVLSQTFKDVEIIVIDDGSTDGGGRLCDAYAERDVRIQVFHTENRGLSAARNLGLEKATGDYVAFLDSDDWIEEDFLQRMVETAESYDSDIVCCRYSYDYRGHKEDSQEYRDLLLLAGDDIMLAFLTKPYIGNMAWNKLYRRALFSDIRYPEGRYYEDIATTYRLMMKAERVVCIPEVLVHYRVRAGSICRSYDLMNMSDYWWAYRKCYKDLCRYSEKYGTLAVGPCMNAIGYMWLWYSRLTREEKKSAKPVLKEMQRFAAEHRRELLCNDRAKKKQKFFCMCAMTTDPVFMRGLYVMNRVYRRVKRRDMGMY